MHSFLAARTAGIDLFDGLYPITLAEMGTAIVFEFGNLAADGGGGSGAEGSTAGGAGGDAPAPAAMKINLWSSEFQEDMGPLVAGCSCVACTKYSRAYLHHLLMTHEMLGVVALTHHNVTHYNNFFGAIRQTIRAGSFNDSKDAFASKYLYTEEPP